MPSGDGWLEEVAQWVEKAEEDLIAAAHLLKLGAKGPLGAVGFHAQQAIEKYLKAVLVACGLVFPKTHDVAKLIALLPKDTRPSLSPELQERLTDYATALRYPGDAEPMSLGEARRALAAARRVRKEIRRCLPKAALRRGRRDKG
jgi:HEPN domain-containing protein